MKRIRLLKDWESYKAGALLDVDPTTASEMIDAKTAELYDPEAEAKAQAEAEAQRKAEEEQIRRIVVEAVSDLQKSGNSTPPAKTHERVEDDPKKGFKGLWDFAHAVRTSGLPGGDFDKRLLVVMDKEQREKAPSGMNVGIDSEGGFLVPEEMSAQLMEKTFDEAQMLQRCTRIPMTTQTWKVNAIAETSRADGSRQGGVRVYRRAEAAQYTGSKTAFSQVKLELEKLTGLAYETDEATKWPSPAIEPILQTLFSREFAFTIQEELVRGTGAAQCLGVLNAGCLVTQAAEAAQAASTILAENIIKMWSRMYARSRRNAVWFINQDIEPQLYTMTIAAGTAGILVYMPPGGISGAQYGTIFGRPVIPIEHCETLGTVGDIILADMGEYLYGEEASGMNYATSIHLKFDYGEVAYRWTMWNDGRPWWHTTLTPYKGTSNTQSPFVVLATRA